MNPNVSALLKSSVAIFLLYWLVYYATVLPEMIYMFALDIGLL